MVRNAGMVGYRKFDTRFVAEKRALRQRSENIKFYDNIGARGKATNVRALHKNNYLDRFSGFGQVKE